MSATEVTKIVTAASALSETELAEVLLKLQALSSLSITCTTPRSSTDDLRAQILYDALSSQLQAQLQIQPIPIYTFFSRSKTAPQVKESLALAVEQLSTLAPGMTRTEWSSVSDLVAGLVVNQVRQSGFKVPWYGVTVLLKNLPQLLDEHFPGYASSNLLRLVLRLRTQKRNLNVRN